MHLLSMWGSTGLPTRVPPVVEAEFEGGQPELRLHALSHDCTRPPSFSLVTLLIIASTPSA